MRIPLIEHGGVGYAEMTAEELADAGVPKKLIEAETKKLDALAGRDQVRATIARTVADTPSLVGTVANGVGVLIAVALADIVAMASSDTYAKYKTAKFTALQAIAGDADMPALAADALAKIQSGEVILTASLKGLNGVITESLVRSTSVATILQAASQAPAEDE